MSRVRPQYAIWGTVVKFKDTRYPECDHIYKALRQTLILYVPKFSSRGVRRRERAVSSPCFDAYRNWKMQRPPDYFRQHTRATKRFHPTYGLPSAIDDEAPCYSSEEERASPLSFTELLKRARWIKQWILDSELSVWEFSGWETQPLNDDHNFDSEPVFPPRTATDWCNWRSSWKHRRGVPQDTSLFSSNDWAALEHHVCLPASAT